MLAWCHPCRKLVRDRKLYKDLCETATWPFPLPEELKCDDVLAKVVLPPSAVSAPPEAAPQTAAPAQTHPVPVSDLGEPSPQAEPAAVAVSMAALPEPSGAPTFRVVLRACAHMRALQELGVQREDLAALYDTTRELAASR